MSKKEALEVLIYEHLVENFGEPDGGYQADTLCAAISKLVGLCRTFKSDRTLRAWYRSESSFAKSVERACRGRGAH